MQPKLTQSLGRATLQDLYNMLQQKEKEKVMQQVAILGYCYDTSDCTGTPIAFVGPVREGCCDQNDGVSFRYPNSEIGSNCPRTANCEFSSLLLIVYVPEVELLYVGFQAHSFVLR